MQVLSQRSTSSGSTTELALIKRVAQGDPRACRVLAHRLSGRVQHLIRQLLGDSDACDAIIVDALIEILRAAAIYRHDVGIEAWADRVAVRVALDRTPRRTRGRPATARTRLLAPVRALSAQGSAHCLSECLLALPQLERQLLVLRQLARLELKIVATLLRLPEPQVRSQLCAATAHIRQLLGSMLGPASQAAERRRWADCIDRRILGETLGPEDQEFCERFGTSDPCASAERALLEELGRHELEPNAQSRALVDAVLHRFAERAERAERDEVARIKAPPSPRMGWLVLAGTVLLLGLALLLFPNAHPEHRVAPRAATAPLPPRVGVVHAAGEVRIDGELVTPEAMLLAEGARLSVGAGSACVQMDHGATLCASAGTLVRLTLARSDARQLDLETGQLAIRTPAQARGSELTLVAGALRVTSAAATFSLDVDQTEGIRARVVEGTVTLTAGASSVVVAAPKAAELRGEGAGFALAPLLDDDAATIHALLEPALGWRKPLAATLDLRKLPADAEVWVDDRALGVTPLLSAIPSGRHALQVRAGDRILTALDFSAETGKLTALSLGSQVELDPASGRQATR